SQGEGDKRAERFEIEHGPCPCQRHRDGGDHGSGVEVSGSAVSVPRKSRQLRGCESWHPFQPPPSPRCYREVHQLPREGSLMLRTKWLRCVGAKRSSGRRAVDLSGRTTSNRTSIVLPRWFVDDGSTVWIA